MTPVFHSTRAHAQQILKGFIERIPAYAFRRNFVSSTLEEVSTLSPYIRLRLLSEEEVIQEVLCHHSFSIAEKFIQEVCWRSYWKNWLAHNPSVWATYIDFLTQERSATLRQQLASCEDATTPIPTLNAWIHQLKTSGYLHNHIRMYFASIWIHTLKLPWQYGAELFMKNLYDADPASNTLSWRWVAGIHTKGKAYLARAENIANFTGIPFDCGDLTLATSPLPQEDQIRATTNLTTPIITTIKFEERPYIILIHQEELSLECVIPEAVCKKSIIIFITTDTTETVNAAKFKDKAMLDAVERMSSYSQACFMCDSGAALEDILVKNPHTPIVAFLPSIGFCQKQFLSLLSGTSLFHQITFTQRPWDFFASFPRSTGFFTYWESLKQKLTTQYS